MSASATATRKRTLSTTGRHVSGKSVELVTFIGGLLVGALAYVIVRGLASSFYGAASQLPILFGVVAGILTLTLISAVGQAVSHTLRGVSENHLHVCNDVH